MNKSELIAKLADKTDLTQKQTGAVISALTETITEALKAGEAVQLTGFGTFEVRTRAARTGHNPSTGESIQIAESKVPAFKPGKGLKDAVQA